VITYQSHVRRGLPVRYDHTFALYRLSAAGKEAWTVDDALRVVVTAAAQPTIAGVCSEGTLFLDPLRLVPFATDDKTAFDRALALGLLEEITVI
jgi:hypothetical protein